MNEHPKDPNKTASSPAIDFPAESEMQKDESRVIREARLKEGLPDSSLDAPVQNGPSPFKNLHSNR